MDALEARLQARLPLWGKWQIAERIYRSSSCSVYALSGERLGQPLSSVVKVITLLGQGDELEEKLQLALEEIRSMERLRGCRNIVTLYDDCLFPLECGGELAGYDILIRMERLTCLTDLLREGTILEADEVCRLGRDLCTALAAAHQAGIIHRDIKPANIYRTADGVYQLGDFSVARQAQSSMLETMTGTAAYMAPEIARGNAYDSRADLYSLGIVLYQLLNRNHLPLTGPHTTYAQRESALRRRWDGARLPLPPDGSLHLRRLVRRCCAADPARRIQSAQALQGALEPSRPERFWKSAAVIGWCGAALATAALLLLPLYAGRLALRADPDAARDGVSAAELQEAPDALEQPDAVHRYTVIQAQMTWEEARAYCESRGGHLATVLDPEQMETVAALLEQNGIQNAWLGASNLNSSGGFQWVTGDPFSYAVWAIGEPNNSNGTEHYLMMYQTAEEGWCWNDSHERGMWVFPESSCGFVCQWDDANE